MSLNGNCSTDIFPDVVRIESSGKCNFKCLHCSHAQKDHLRPNLSYEIFNKILSQFEYKNFIPRVVVLYHGGEPLLNKNIFNFIKDLKSYGVKFTRIVSNAALLTQEIIEKLIDAGLDEISFSFDGLSPEENNAIRRNGNFERDSQNVINFLNTVRKRKSNIRVKIANVQFYEKRELKNHMTNNENKKMPNYILEKFHKYPEIIYESHPAMVWPGFDIKSSIFSICKSNVKSPDYCPSAFETISILSNGDIVPCCYDICGEKVFGNVLNDNIFEIWKNKEYGAFRNAIKGSNPDNFCKKCLVYSGEYLVKTC